MKTYQFYKEEGNLFIFKNQPVFMSLMVIFMLIAAVIAYRERMPLLLILFFIAAAALIAINFFAKKLVIDPQRKTITGRHSIFVSAKTYSFEDFTNFNILAMKYMGLFTTNVILSAHFNVNGKTKILTIGQSITRKGIQKMVNETEDIMRLNESIR